MPFGATQGWKAWLNDTTNCVILIEPPAKRADPHVRWCERGRLITAPYSIYDLPLQLCLITEDKTWKTFFHFSGYFSKSICLAHQVPLRSVCSITRSLAIW